MLVIRRLLLLIAFLIDPIIPIDPIVQGIVISTDYFGPFTAYQENVDLNIKITSNDKGYFYERFTCGPSYEDIRYAITSDNHQINKSYNYVVNLPTYMLLSNNGLYCTLSVTSIKMEYTRKFQFCIKPITFGHNIDPSKYTTNSYSISETYYRILGGKLSSYSETYSFPDFLDYLNIDTYYRIDLSGVTFNCGPVIKDYAYESASMKISDYQNIFPYLTHDENHYVSIPLIVTNNKTKKGFAFANNMYVHPKTLEMSLIERSNFVQTRHFYLPVNKKKEMLEENIQIIIRGGGAAKSNLTWNLSYLATGNYLGNCANSDYCVVGGFSND